MFQQSTYTHVVDERGACFDESRSTGLVAELEGGLQNTRIYKSDLLLRRRHEQLFHTSDSNSNEFEGREGVELIHRTR